jgi:hypothetical protein
MNPTYKPESLVSKYANIPVGFSLPEPHPPYIPPSRGEIYEKIFRSQMNSATLSGQWDLVLGVLTRNDCHNSSELLSDAFETFGNIDKLSDYPFANTGFIKRLEEKSAQLLLIVLSDAKLSPAYKSLHKYLFDGSCRRLMHTVNTAYDSIVQRQELATYLTSKEYHANCYTAGICSLFKAIECRSNSEKKDFQE